MITPEIEVLVATHCDVIAPVLNWRLMDRGRSLLLDLDADRGVSVLAERLGRQTTGVHLLWHEALPAWFAALSDGAKKDAVARFIRAMGSRFSNRFWSVNVVNEFVNPEDGLPGGLRRSALTDRFGDTSLLELAFHVAREAFPRSLLVYNEYGLEQDGPGTTAKRAAVLAQLDALQRARVPIDAVGLQSHLSFGRRFDNETFARFLRTLADRGLLVILTELDVLDVDAPADIGARDQAVASLYRRFLDTALADPVVRGVVVWGLSDRDTWLNPRTSNRFARRDGLATRPLPFDDELRPKPAFEAIAAALAGAPPRTQARRP